jgi:hypothetical protein
MSGRPPKAPIAAATTQTGDEALIDRIWCESAWAAVIEQCTDLSGISYHAGDRARLCI